MPSEYQLYKYHHRARMAIKPGVTGMWQVSGRSEITDFEEVVRLDTEYITNWSIGTVKTTPWIIWVISGDLYHETIGQGSAQVSGVPFILGLRSIVTAMIVSKPPAVAVAMGLW